jgi:hypothetical protein
MVCSGRFSGDAALGLRLHDAAGIRAREARKDRFDPRRGLENAENPEERPNRRRENQPGDKAKPEKFEEGCHSKSLIQENQKLQSRKADHQKP